MGDHLRRDILRAGAALPMAAPAAAFAAPATPQSPSNTSYPDRLRRRDEAMKAPVPLSISPEAQKNMQAGLARMAAAVALGEQPPPQDVAAIKAQIAKMNSQFEPLIDEILRASAARVERASLGGVEVGMATPLQMRHRDRAMLKFHGGGFTLLGGRFVEADAARAASDGGCMAYSVDYRMPPDFPAPAAVDDGVAVYRELLKTYHPSKIIISGESAGGNLAATVTLKARDLGLPLPGAVGLITPATDLTGGGDTWETNFGFDYMLMTFSISGAQLYANGRDLRDPYLSPLFADLSKGFPPTYLQAGTRDRLLSDTVRMHRALLAAGVDAELHVWEAMPHAGFGGAPEDLEIRRQFQAFVTKRLTA